MRRVSRADDTQCCWACTAERSSRHSAVVSGNCIRRPLITNCRMTYVCLQWIWSPTPYTCASELPCHRQACGRLLGQITLQQFVTALHGRRWNAFPSFCATQQLSTVSVFICDVTSRASCSIFGRSLVQTPARIRAVVSAQYPLVPPGIFRDRREIKTITASFQILGNWLFTNRRTIWLIAWAADSVVK
jgi:hypothetical protein